MTRRRYELTDGEWLIIAPLLPNKPRGVPRIDDRERHSLAFPHWLAVGGDTRTLWPLDDLLQPFRPLAQSRGVGPAAFGGFSRLRGRVVMINSTCVRVHQHGATGKKGDPQIAAWDVPEAASRARSMPSLMLTVVPSPCA